MEDGIVEVVILDVVQEIPDRSTKRFEPSSGGGALAKSATPGSDTDEASQPATW
jgi:hypothetical protein